MYECYHLQTAYIIQSHVVVPHCVSGLIISTMNQMHSIFSLSPTALVIKF
jgi:hypothetical protein